MSQKLPYKHITKKSHFLALLLLCMFPLQGALASERCATNQLGHCLKQTFVVQEGKYGTFLKIRTKELSASRGRTGGTAPQAQISEPRLEKLHNGDGMWRGKISGLGRVILRLVISNPSGFDQSHLIGQVELARHKAPIAFSYRRSLPRLPKWSWKIVAHPTS